ncbi:hypothetical protein [Flavobacterium sp. CSZ]|uniref:hypothetical protein n=1 Tax=Flavobacterium sp. CSZ TaxID=2783791 RepID=UPI00188DBBC1|nr:hypothetical protein [Flavobacterium sp. CSZ]MBF4484437.1 hypothetical protein [Flavobacterium sp. CSZ]
MNKNVQRIGVGNSRFPSVNESVGLIEPGIFTFDSMTVTFDSTVDTFDFDIIPLPPVVVEDYSNVDYLKPDYK